MTKYLISFPSEAMVVAAEDMPAVGTASRAVIAEAKAAGVYVFAGGIDEEVGPALVSADGAIASDHQAIRRLNGGFAVLELPTWDDAVAWAEKLAVACRCPQEVRAFMYDPAS